MKRLIDIVAAAVGLLMLSPLLAILAVLVKRSSPGPVFFRHERVGKGFRPLGVLKFRTMIKDAPMLGGSITVGGDPRITRVGRWLRATKLDELPQLVNVLTGGMSLVGPRPEVSRYVEMFHDDYSIILRMRPGMTDLASIEYLDEETLLAAAADPGEEYVRHILPEKIRLGKEYVRRQSLALDIRIIFGTLLRLVKRPRPKAAGLCEKNRDAGYT